LVFFKISQKQKGEIIMSVGAIVTLVLSILGFVGIAIWAFTLGRKYRWPKGVLRSRKTKGGIEVVVINAPGSSLEKELDVTDACCRAVQACFTAWDRLHPDNKAKSEIDVVGVSFISDIEMDKIQEKMPYERVAAYLCFTSRSVGSSAPTAVVRSSLILNVVSKGEPVIHEMIHALLHRCSNVGFDYEHKDESWIIVSRSARAEYQNLSS
jgi:hypothetical protein